MALLGGLYFTVSVSGACGGASTPPKAASSSADGGVIGSSSSDPGALQTGPVPASGPPIGDELSGDAKVAYENGWRAWSEGNLPAAKAAFQDAASKAPKAGGPQYSLGCVLERLGETQAALDAYKAGFTADPLKYAASMGAYAILEARTGHGSDADRLLSGKVAERPDDVQLMTYLADVKSMEGDSPGCQKIAQDVLTKKPDFAGAMIVIARDYYRAHKWDLARYALTSILDGDSAIPARAKGNPEALLLRGLMRKETPTLRKFAMEDFAAAIAAQGDMFEAYINLGEMKLEAGNAADARDPLEKAVRFSPNTAVAHLDLGDCYRLLARPGDAKAELEKALSLDSTLSGVHYNLALLYLFASSNDVVGMKSDDERVNKAIKELDTYKQMLHGAKAAKTQLDDAENLLNTAKSMQADIQMAAQAAAGSAAPTPTGPDGGPPAAPAPSAAPVASGAAAAVSPAPSAKGP
jgi:tetratricopeptide (TPR) repeat protein